MMQGATAYCTAVRDPEGAVQVERLRLNRSPSAQKAAKIPFVRGVVNMFSSLVRGTKTLMRSAQVYGGDEGEPGRVQSWLAEKFKVDIMEIATFIAALIGAVVHTRLLIAHIRSDAVGQSTRTRVGVGAVTFEHQRAEGAAVVQRIQPGRLLIDPRETIVLLII